jgi:F-type H+-transporting ATPase subunit b
MREIKLLSAALAGVLPAVAASAAEHGAEGGGGWNPLVDGDFGNFFWTLLTLVVVYLVLKKWAWGPLLAALQDRERFIEDSLNQAVAEREQAREQLHKYEEKLATARGEVDAMLDEARRDAAALREREEVRAKEEARLIVERARREIDVAADTAVKRLYEHAAQLSTSAAAKILDRELTAADHDRLVAEAIEALGSNRPGAGTGAERAH